MARHRRGVLLTVAAIAAIGVIAGCSRGAAAPVPPVIPESLPADTTNVVFLHHSTGDRIWKGGVQERVGASAKAAGLKVNIVERSYPNKPHYWENNPFEYWNLWVAHSGESRYKDQATLEQLTKAYDVIVWKNCYISADIEEGGPDGDVTSNKRTVANFKAQYTALKEKMHSFPDTTFVVWTIPPKAAAATTPEAARRTDEFTEWVRTEWDEPGDNIFLWDFRALSADHGVLKAEYATSEKDSHPNPQLAAEAAPLFAQRLVDVIAGRGDATATTGARLAQQQ